jgi:hypothetical protein
MPSLWEFCFAGMLLSMLRRLQLPMGSHMNTDQELRLALAKMLPEKIRVAESFFWIDGVLDNWTVRDTEWLHVCHLIEKSMGPTTRNEFSHELECVMDSQPRDYKDMPWRAHLVSTTWQQRAEALIKTKGEKP